MTEDSWVSVGQVLPGGLILETCLEKGDGWQIFASHAGQKVLLAEKNLSLSWERAGLLKENRRGLLEFLGREFYAWESAAGNDIFCLAGHKGPSNETEALSLARALKATRSVNRDLSLHSAVYFEELDRLLPSPDQSENVPDDIVLGTWLTGGVCLSTDNFVRLCQLVGWLDRSELTDIINQAGLTKPHNQKKEPGPRLYPENRPPEEFSLPGRPELETFFKDHILDIIFNLPKYQAVGLDFPAPVVLHGPPGCGKTFAVQKLVDFLGWPSFSVDSTSIGSPYVHQTGQKIAEVFELAVKAAPSVIIMDEMEAFLASRQQTAGSQVHHLEEVAEFLRLIPQAPQNKVLLLAMTNAIDLVDPAVLRRGRIDHVLEVGPPTAAETEALLTCLLAKLPYDPKLNLRPITERLTGRALSDSAFVIREAARLTAKKGQSFIDLEILEEALKSLPQEMKPRKVGFRQPD